jgi:lysozyme
MSLADAYVDQIKKFEGYAARPVWDYKQYSGGYGTRAQPGMTFTPETADAALRQELGQAKSHVAKLGVPLTPGQEAALTSLTFNAGPGWMNAGLGQAVKAGDWDKATSLFQQYNKAGGEVLPGLVSRRAAEAQWMTGGNVSRATNAAPGSFRAAQAMPQPQETTMQPMGFMPQLDPAMMQQQPGQQQGGLGGFLQGVTSNPLFLMGAGILGGKNVGEGLMGGLQMSNQMQQQALERQRQQAADQRTNAMHPLQMQLLEANVRKANEPPSSEDIREFQFAKKEGFAGGFEQWMTNKRAQANGGLYGQNGQIFQDKNGNFFSLQFGRDGSQKVQPVTAPGGDGAGLMPAKGVEKVGDSLINKATGQEVRAIGANISGEQVAKETGEAKGKFIANLPKHEATISSMATQDKLMGQEIARSVDLIDKGGVTSWMGAVAKYAPGTPAYELANRIKTIKANVGFDRLQQMRAESPTGGALGQVAVQELESLQSVLGSFDQAQDAATLKGNLTRLNEMLATRATRMKAMLDQDKQRFGTMAPGLNPAAAQQAPAAPATGGQSFRYNPSSGQLEPM